MEKKKEDSLRINRDIKASTVRLIGPNGEQIGIMSGRDAQRRAEQEGLDLVEIAPGAVPPVCKIIDYGKFRYDQTKREKESKKASHQIKVKEIKFRPNIGENDLKIKLTKAKEFLVEGNKVKVTCMFRGREQAHPEIGERLVQKILDDVKEIAVVESPMKLFGRFLTAVIAPSLKKAK